MRNALEHYYNSSRTPARVGGEAFRPNQPRRNQRTVTIAAAMAANPDKSIPKMFIHGYDIKAAYNFFSHPEATPDNVQLAHRELVLEQMRLPGRYLLLEDNSEMSWSGNLPIPGLGPLGS